MNVNRLIAELEPFLCPAASYGIELVLDLSSVLDPSHIDPVQFEAALLNLTINARDAMTGGGRITVETRNAELDDDYAADNTEISPGSYIMVAVSDNGAGMAPDIAAHAFEPFFTTKEVGKGSGLGLSQVYGFAKSAGGHVKIYSETGVGTTVKLYLPRSADQFVEATEPRPGMVPLRPANGHEIILVVEDNPNVLAYAVEVLSELGYHVLSAPDARQALDILCGNEPIDLMFSDVVMPGGMNGVQLAVEARRARPGIKVLLTSGYTASALSGDHALPENIEMLGKPYRHSDLADKLRLVISR
jgi:CheY-like chemotaxis protein